MKKTLALFLALAMVFALAACGNSAAAPTAAPENPAEAAPAAPSAGTYQISVSTGGATGMYYTTLAPICDYVNSSTNKVRVVPATSGGSTENLNNVLNGICDLGCVYNNEVVSGYESNNSLRFVGPTTKCSPLQFVVKADSGITSIEDLVGKNVHLGAAGSGARAWAVQFFEFLGVYDKITEVPLGNEDCVSGLGDDDVVMITVAGLAPSARVTEASASYDIALLDLSAYMDDFLAAYPYFETYTIEAGTYTGVDADILTFGLATSIVCTEDMDYDALYEFMTYAYCEEAQNLALTTNPNGPDHNPENPLANMSIPIHPAAKQFWEDKGFDVPEV